MDLKPIKTEDDYETALAEIDRLWDAEENTPESDRLEILVTLAEVYERGRYELPPPDPISAIEYFMESRGWSRANLTPLIGSEEGVSAILDRKRPLTLAMIRRMEQATGIPASVLIRPYATDEEELGSDLAVSGIAPSIATT